MVSQRIMPCLMGEGADIQSEEPNLNAVPRSQRLMSYIEHDFPIEGLNNIAQKEGNAKKPIYQMHKTSTSSVR